MSKWDEASEGEQAETFAGTLKMLEVHAAYRNPLCVGVSLLCLSQ